MWMEGWLVVCHAGDSPAHRKLQMPEQMPQSLLPFWICTARKYNVIFFSLVLSSAAIWPFLDWHITTPQTIKNLDMACLTANVWNYDPVAISNVQNLIKLTLLNVKCCFTECYLHRDKFSVTISERHLQLHQPANLLLQGSSSLSCATLIP